MKKWTILLVTLVFAGMIFWSCSGDDGTTDPGDTSTLTCEISAPLDLIGFNAGDSIDVVAVADDDNSTIVEVRFLIDDNGFSSDKEFPYTAKIPTDTLAVGTHTITAVAENDNGKEVTTSIGFGIIPKSPTNLNITQLNVYSFSLSWNDNSTGEDGFKIERKIDDGEFTEISTTTERTFVDSTVSKKGLGTVYYQVRAFKEIYNSEYVSNNATVGFPAPSNLNIAPTSVTSATLTWNDNSDGEDRFEIERKLSTETSYINIAEIPGSETTTKSWNDSSLNPTVIYDYRIKARKGDNSTSYTSISGYIPFLAPENLNITQTSITSAYLIWDDFSIGEDKFEIERKLSVESTYIKVGEVTGSDTGTKSYSDTTVIPNLIYNYQIKATKESFYSSYVQKAYDNTFQAPTNFTVTHINLSSATLSWTDNSIGEEKFEIERKLSTESTYIIVGEVTGSDISTKNWEDTNLDMELTYDYRIKAVSGTNSSNYSVTSYENTIPSPSNLSYTVLDMATLKLDWTDNSNVEDGFKIDRKVGELGNWVENYAIVGENVETWLDSDYDIIETYYYRVRAYYSTYFSYSSEIYITKKTDGMVYIPSGDFNMGSDEYWDEEPIHSVILTNNFYMGKYEITNQEYCDMLNYARDEGALTDYSGYVTVMNITGDQQELLDIDGYGCQINFNGTIFDVESGMENRPVVKVTWYGSVFYCNMLAKQHGLTELYDLTTWNCNYYGNIGFRLPSEAEWEYSAKYNDNRIYPWGNSGYPPDYANVYYTGIGHTIDVGGYSPIGDSELGLCDMAGNVSEWCGDWYDSYLSQTQENPTGPSTILSTRVVRSNSYRGSMDGTRTSSRFKREPNDSYDDLGFRIVLIP